MKRSGRLLRIFGDNRHPAGDDQDAGPFPPGLLCLSVLLLGFLLRITYLYQFSQTPFFTAHLLSGLDQRTWGELGSRVMAHPWFVDGRPFYQAPGYAYLLGFIFRLFGDNNYLAAGIIQAGLDMSGAYMLFLLGRKLWNFRVGLAACAVYALYRPFIFYSVTLLSDSFILFTNILCLFLTYWVLDRPAHKRRWLLAGFGFGLAVLAKPTIMLYLLFIFAAFMVIRVLARDPENRVPLKKVLLPGIIIFTAGFILPVLPVVARNSLYAGQLTGVATYGGINWEIGNSADSIGLFMYPEGGLLSPGSRDFWTLWGRKTLLFFSSYEWPQNLNMYLMAGLCSVLALPLITFGLVAPLGLAGLFSGWSPRRSYLYLYTLANVLAIVAFFITSRYRLPAAAGFILLACGYVDDMVLRVKALSERSKPARNLQSLARLAAGLILALAISFTVVNTWDGPRIGEAYLGNYAIMTRRSVDYHLERGEVGLARRHRALFQRFTRDYQAGIIR